MSIYDTLNEQQREAVFHTEGPLLILAGAGSGKTRVITHRIAYLIDECEVNPWNILAITFTNKAAGEMKERVKKLVGFGSESIWISTFHSMCVRILKRYSAQVGMEDGFVIYDTDDSRALIKQVMTSLNVNPKNFSDRSLLTQISHAKERLETPEAFYELHGGSRELETVGRVYEAYQRGLQKNNAMDFDDLLMKTVELLRDNEEVRRTWQDRFHYIMVDEYQDTNMAQFEIVRYLAEPRRNLCVVGDDDQSIYRFRGADIRNILDFEKSFPDAKVIRLEQNYRSTQTILDAANAVIAHNSRRKSKHLWTDQGAGAPITVKVLPDPKSEAQYIADSIQDEMERDEKRSYKDFAVLYRTNAQSRLLEEFFVRRSIPYNIVGGHNFYDRMEVKDILGYLRTIANGRDDISTLRIINIPRRGIGKTSLDRVVQHAQNNGISVLEALHNLSAISGIERAKRGLESFAGEIDDLREFAADHDADEVIEEILDVIGYRDYLAEYDENSEERLENLDELISKAGDYVDAAQAAGEEASLSGFLDDVALVADIDDVGESDNRVLLMTLHSAKGLEFPFVTIAGMEQGLFPSSMVLRSESLDDLEEERRLAYVGITRAKEKLTLTLAESRVIHGEFSEQFPSMFLEEIPGELLENGSGRGSRKRPEYEDEMPFAPAPSPVRAPSPAPAPKPRAAVDRRPKAVYVKPHTEEAKKPYIARQSGLGSLTKGAPTAVIDYAVGDRVRHVKYGDGTVTAMEPGPKDTKVTVMFDEEGQRMMYAGFAKLVRI